MIRICNAIHGEFEFGCAIGQMSEPILDDRLMIYQSRFMIVDGDKIGDPQSI